MAMNQEALSKLDAGFDEARETETVDAKEALQLLGKAIRGAATEQDSDVAKARIQRMFCLGNEVLKALDDDGEGTSIELPVDMLAEVRKDTDGQAANVIPISAAMADIGKRFGKVDGEPEPTNKNAGDEGDDEDVPTFDSGIDLNTEQFDPNNVDWGPDPDFNS